MFKGTTVYSYLQRQLFIGPSSLAMMITGFKLKFLEHLQLYPGLSQGALN